MCRALNLLSSRAHERLRWKPHRRHLPCEPRYLELGENKRAATCPGASLQHHLGELGHASAPYLVILQLRPSEPTATS
eukprot:3294998-Rhodomonas_salina.1